MIRKLPLAVGSRVTHRKDTPPLRGSGVVTEVLPYWEYRVKWDNQRLPEIHVGIELKEVE
jgi:hypothetical protein